MLEIKDLSIAYGDREIVHKAGFTVQPGETVCIVGESGSGKSTMLKAIAGLLGQEGRVTGGSIEFKGRELLRMNRKEYQALRGSRIAMVYQHAGESMDPVMRIGRQFHEELSLKGKISRRESDEKAIVCMKQLLLKEPERILSSYPSMLSGGTNQRVALAMAMVMEPDLILADEPTSALDVTVQAEVVKAMKNIKQVTNAAILMVTHNMGVVAQMADKVGVMQKGKLVEWGTAEEVLSHPTHDYTKMLMSCVLRMEDGDE